MKMWSDLLLLFAKSNTLYATSLSELYASSLLNNQVISRRLSIDALRAVVQWMQGKGFAEFAGDAAGDKVFLYWRSLQEVAASIHAWADRTGRIGSVETVMDLTDDPANKTEIFYKMPIEVILKACTQLQSQGKAQVFYSDNTDTHGVKFFNI